MATTSAPQLNKKWFECNMDGEWSKSLANVRQITEEVLLRILVDVDVVERASDIVTYTEIKNKQSQRRQSRSRCTIFFRDGLVKKMHVCKSLTNDSMLIVKAQVLASMKKIYYKVYVGFRDCGEIAGANCVCDCVAG